MAVAEDSASRTFNLDKRSADRSVCETSAEPRYLCVLSAHGDADPELVLVYVSDIGRGILWNSLVAARSAQPYIGRSATHHNTRCSRRKRIVVRTGEH